MSPSRHPALISLLRGLPHSLVLENENRQLHVMVPLHPLRRAFVQECPFTRHVWQLRGDPEWHEATTTRVYVTLASAVGAIRRCL